MKRRILLVDDEVAILLTLKAVLEINGFDVDTAASGREGKAKLRTHEYIMVITDMRMESDAAGAEVIAAARAASYRPAIALLTAFPIADEDWQTIGADKMLVKPMHTRVLLQQIEKLLDAHLAKLSLCNSPAPRPAPRRAAGAGTSKPSAKKTAPRKSPPKRTVAKRTVAKRSVAKRPLTMSAAKTPKRTAKKA